jgi:adenosylhomocysteine nucleosidase
MLHIVTALPCEANPLIRHYRLNGRQRENGFRIYENAQLRLIIAGVGQYAAAAACAYLQGADPQAKHAWLNLGIAGHGRLEVGTAVLAHMISDATGTAWYPPLPFNPPCETVELVSVDQPETDYPGEAAYDMEAAGFYATAGRFNSHELVQVVKVISDNQANPAHQVTVEQTEALISARLDTIDTVLTQLDQLEKQLSQQQPSSEIMEPFLQQWHFSTTQRHQLQRLLQRWEALSGDIPNAAEFKTAHNSKQLIAALKEKIAGLPLTFP